MADWVVALVRGKVVTIVDDVGSAASAVVEIHGPYNLEMVVGRRDDATWWVQEVRKDGFTGPVYSLREKW